MTTLEKSGYGIPQEHAYDMTADLLAGGMMIIACLAVCTFIVANSFTPAHASQGIQTNASECAQWKAGEMIVGTKQLQEVTNLCNKYGA